MDITLERSLTAAVRYIQDHSGEGTKLYFDEIPESFYVPSIYFPVPRTTSKKVSLDTYRTTVCMEAWFLASEDWLAEDAAVRIRDAILLDDCKIPFVSKDGLLLEKGFRVGEPEVKPAGDRTVKLLVNLNTYMQKARPVHPAMENINISVTGKHAATDGFYSAWYAATEKQRKEEEVRDKCLREVLESL